MVRSFEGKLSSVLACVRTVKPTPKDIEAAIANMIGPEPLGPGDPDVPLCVPLWYVTAYDPEGNKRGIGIDSTLAGAAAAAWVLSHDDVANQFGRVPLSLHDFDRVPRHVPNGWTFEIENMPKQESA
jgi:hypothetical protein